MLGRLNHTLKRQISKLLLVELTLHGAHSGIVVRTR
jgi:hypothetical protein